MASDSSERPFVNGNPILRVNRPCRFFIPIDHSLEIQGWRYRTAFTNRGLLPPLPEAASAAGAAFLQLFLTSHNTLYP
jgi:hypothetical protein